MNNIGALEGIRVMDFTWVMAGPRATKALADLGAEVIRVEARGRLDGMRTGGGNVYGKEMVPGGRFKEFNRNKLGVTLNMRHPKGLEMAKQLLKICDVVIENFSAGVLDRWGFGYEVMKSVKPDIIYVSMAGFGHTGPYQPYISHGPILQAMAGYTYCTGFPGMAPVVMGAYADFIGGASGALAVMMALECRQHTGKGQYIDLSQYQAITAIMGTAVLDYTINGRATDKVGVGNYHQAAAPYGTYCCAGDDRWCVINVFTEEEWQAFCRAMGNPAWTSESAFATLPQRIKNREELDKRVTEWTRQRSPEEVMHLLQKAGVPAAAVQNAVDMAKDAHLQARGFWEYDEDPDIGVMTYEGVPEKLSETPGHVRRPTPTVGQHNDYVYGKLLGLSPETIKQYTEEGIF